MKIFSSLVLGILTVGMVGLALFGKPPVNNVFAKREDDKQTITICHRNDNVNDPYTTESPEVANNGDLQGGHLDHTGPLASSVAVAQALKDAHTKWGDIIPPYDFGEDGHFDGYNWPAGQAIWNNDCKYPPPPVDQCINLSGDQVTVPPNMQTNSDNFCSCLEGFHQVAIGETEDFTCDPNTPTETVTPIPPPGNPGGPGDGLSDGRSDGRSSCPSCTQAPQGQVLGATTEFAGTGVADEIAMNIVGAIGGLTTASGLVLAAKKKFIK